MRGSDKRRSKRLPLTLTLSPRKSGERDARGAIGRGPRHILARAGTRADVSAPARPTLGAAAPSSRHARNRRERPRSTTAPIKVTVGQLEEAGGATRISQSFVLPHPREAVWRLMSDVAAVARCMPGLSLDGPPQGDKVAGRLEARIGPISASFAGEGTITQFPAEYRQVIEGSGGDRRSGSRASGSVDYRLSAVAGEAGRDATRVDVTISYALTGALAQIGRSGLVRDLVRRIGEAFAQNLDAQLRDPAAAMPRARLGGLSLLLHVIADRIRAVLAKLSGQAAITRHVRIQLSGKAQIKP